MTSPEELLDDLMYIEGHAEYYLESEDDILMAVVNIVFLLVALWVRHAR